MMVVQVAGKPEIHRTTFGKWKMNDKAQEVYVDNIHIDQNKTNER